MPQVVKRRDVLAAVSRGEAEYLAPAKEITRQQPEPEDPMAPLVAALQSVVGQMQSASSSTKELLAKTVEEQSKVLASLAAQISAMNKPVPTVEKPAYRPISLLVSRRDSEGRIAEVTVKEQ